MFSLRPLLQSNARRLSIQAPQYKRNQVITASFSTATRKMAEEYKLKGLQALNLKPGEKKEVEVDGIEEGKVLIMNVNGKHTALGSKCTHYGML